MNELRRCLRFIRLYLPHWLTYPPFFFTHAPAKVWHTLLASTHRVAYSCAYAMLELEGEPDIWSRAARRSNFLRIGRERMAKACGEKQ